jgi:hypothetical protein
MARQLYSTITEGCTGALFHKAIQSIAISEGIVATVVFRLNITGISDAGGFVRECLL